MIVSDHGGGPVSDRVIYLNRFLAQLGSLKYRDQDKSLVSRVKQQAVLAVYKVLYSTLGPAQKKISCRAASEYGRAVEDAYTSFANIDWTATKSLLERDCWPRRQASGLTKRTRRRQALSKSTNKKHCLR
jgi:hypothetical protein